MKDTLEHTLHRMVHSSMHGQLTEAAGAHASIAQVDAEETNGSGSSKAQGKRRKVDRAAVAEPAVTPRPTITSAPLAPATAEPADTPAALGLSTPLTMRSQEEVLPAVLPRGDDAKVHQLLRSMCFLR